MEISRDIAGLFPDEITKFSQDFYKNVRFRSYAVEKQFSEALDAMGHASGAAQGLSTAVTTYNKLKTSKHTLYVLKDMESNDKLIGLLKVGKKKLYILDLKGVQHEVEPLCLLDFYVHESMQRTGCGKKLFDAMLKLEGVKPQHLAIDRPSSKCLNFLKKHYNLHPCRWQANSFVVYDGFFGNMQGAGKKQDKQIPDSLAMEYQHPTSQQYHSHTGNVEIFPDVINQPTNTGNARSEVDSKIYRPQPASSSVYQQQYSSQNFNWSPQYILNQINRSRSNSQQQNGLTEFCSTNAPYLSMRQNNSQRLGLSSQNSINYSRYSGGSTYGAIQPRLPNPTLSSDFSQRYSRNYRSFYK